MITYHTGSIFDSPAQCLINPVNCVGIMGKGLAAEFKTRYPSCVPPYVKLCSNGMLQIGTVGFYRSPVIPFIICYFPTKYDWRYPSKLEYIDSGLLAFLKHAPEHRIKSVAFPKVGCGEGGLNFEYQVRPLIEQRFHNTSYTVEVYI